MKKFISLALAALFVIGFSGCGQKTDVSTDETSKPNEQNQTATNNTVSITYWTPFTGPDGSYMQQIVDEFNASQSNYVVQHEVYDGATYYDKLNTAVPEGNGPDIAALHSERIPTLQNAQIIKEISNNTLESFGLKAEDFLEAPFNAGTYDGKRYSIPLDAHPLVLYYNKDIVDGTNIKVPTTYDELISEGTKATKDGNFGFAYSALWPNELIFRTIMLQNGKEVVDETGTKSNVNNDTGKLGYTLLNDLTTKYKIAPEVLEQDGPIDMFKAGEVAFVIDGIWWITGFKDAGLNFGVAKINTLFGSTPAVWGGSHQIGFINNKDISKEKQDGINAFTKFLYENLIKWSEGGQIVAYKPVLESEEFKALPYLSDVASTLDSVKLSQNTLTWPDLFGPIIQANMGAALTGQVTIEEALAKIESDGNARAAETLQKYGK